MNQDDFFKETTSTSAWGEPTSTRLRTDLLTELRAGPVLEALDLHVALALTQRVWNELIAYGNGEKNTIDDKEIALANGLCHHARPPQHSPEAALARLRNPSGRFG